MTPTPSRPRGPSPNPETASQLLNNLMSVVLEDPEAFRVSIPAISAEHSIDQTVLEALVGEAKAAQRTRKVQDA